MNSFVPSGRATLAAAAVLALGLLPWSAARAQTPGAAPAPHNVFQLSAAGEVEVLQDLLTLSLAITREGVDAASVQSELRQAVDVALTAVKKTAQPGQLDVRTGDFSVQPRYAQGGKINGWHGRAELVLEGRDFPRITQAAARATSMTIERVGFGLSREQRARVETEAQALAIERFKAKAGEIAQAFGFSGYAFREVTVSSTDSGFQPRMVASMAKGMRAAVADAPVAVEPGKSLVQVTVSGSVQAR